MQGSSDVGYENSLTATHSDIVDCAHRLGLKRRSAAKQIPNQNKIAGKHPRLVKTRT